MIFPRAENLARNLYGWGKIEFLEKKVRAFVFSLFLKIRRADPLLLRKFSLVKIPQINFRTNPLSELEARTARLRFMFPKIHRKT